MKLKLLAAAVVPVVASLLFAVPAHADDEIDWMNMGQYAPAQDVYAPPTDPNGVVTFSELYTDDSFDEAATEYMWGPDWQTWYGPWSVGCKTARATLVHYNAYHMELSRFTISQYFCYSDGRITYAPQADAWGNTTFLGNVFGYNYTGVGDRSDWNYTYLGHDDGGHQAFREGMFSDCLAKFACVGNDNVQVQLFVHFDGTWNAYQR